jgi:acetolactate synthase-1/2/3 large subunit
MPNPLMLFGKAVGCDMGEVRWDKTAESFGCHGEYVEHIDDMEAALKRADEHQGPSVVCVKTDIEGNLSVHPDIMGIFQEVYNGPRS